MSPKEQLLYNEDEGSAVEERRRYERQESSTVATTRIGSWWNEKRIPLQLLDISETGLSFSTPSDFSIGQNLKMKIPVSTASGIRGTRVRGIILSKDISPEGNRRYRVRLNNLLETYKENAGADFRRGLIFALMTVLFAIIALFKAFSIFHFWYSPLIQVYSLITSGFIFTRVLLSIRYKMPPDQGYMPTVAVIVPVMNEEAHIAETIERIYKSRYPADKLEVVVIDDGSTDRTWAVLESIQPLYPTLKLHKFPKNRGKRDGMAVGAEEATAEILVYVDSDSFVHPEGIYRLVQPFTDPTIGAVAGHIRVVVEPNNSISKMESVRYYIAHRIVKAAESLFGAVTCCSGAFSAYRRAAVMHVLPEWQNQMFLGTRATFGDDRSLTNFILKTHRVIFHFGADCFTYVPDNWGKFFRQQLRWKKSWTRESIMAAKIMYRKHPAAAIAFYFGVALTLMSPLVVFRALVVLPATNHTNAATYVCGLILVYLFMCAYFFYFNRKSHWYYGIFFAILYLGVLCWQNYYAMATVSETHWGTR